MPNGNLRIFVTSTPDGFLMSHNRAKYEKEVYYRFRHWNSLLQGWSTASSTNVEAHVEGQLISYAESMISKLVHSDRYYTLYNHEIIVDGRLWFHKESHDEDWCHEYDGYVIEVAQEFTVIGTTGPVALPAQKNK